MITIDEFLDLVRDTPSVHRNLRDPDNVAQLNAVLHADDTALMITAGPGSGKTSVLILRALRFVLVDGVLPEQLLITTFTKKAAKELRTRWLDWGSALFGAAGARIDERAYDLNRCHIDTMDSIAQQVLAEHRLPNALAPIVAESSASKLILKRSAFGQTYRDPSAKSELDALFSRYTFDGAAPGNQGAALELAKQLCDRLIQDRVDLRNYQTVGVAQQTIYQVLQAYQSRMTATNVFDFASLQEAFLRRIADGSLANWLAEIRVLMIDEYQDTNPLQEAIYFAIVGEARPSVAVVGDDDQSMYRFRGGSVELFTQFATRLQGSTGVATTRVDMIRNFRSTHEIVSFYNRHITSDSAFAPARIAPSKPEVTASRGASGVPVLGMFRANANQLSSDLAEFLNNLVTNRRFSINGDSQNEITLSEEGNLGDAVLLSHSVEEVRFNRARGGQPAAEETRFVGLLRQELSNHGLHAFNPRGLALRVIPNVQLLLGLLLICIDSDGSVVNETYPTNEARHFLSGWRLSALTFTESNPVPRSGRGLAGFVQDWQAAGTARCPRSFPRDWPVLELLFKLVTWIPAFQIDPEHQVWLEAITRIISSVGMASPYGMLLLQGTGANQMAHVRLSRLSLVRDALLPIAENEVDVDEDIMPSVPRDRLQVMTIHQSKGLEFPLVIVDAGSHYNTNHAGHRFRRHPTEESNVVRMEDDVEPHLATPLRSGRPPMDRSFDDLVRLYYVAFSRPQSVLLIVGNESCLTYGRGRQFRGAIPNIALGWHRDGSWPWRQQANGRTPIRVTPPMQLI